MGQYQSLEVWKQAHRLAIEVSRATSRFPRHERFEPSSPLRRAALSGPTSLVEGPGRFGTSEYLRFVRIAAASCAEVEYLLFFLVRSLERAPRSPRPCSPVFARLRSS